MGTKESTKINTLQKILTSFGIIVVVILGSVSVNWVFDKDFITIKRDGTTIVKERWVVEAERTWFALDSWYDKNVKCPKVIETGGHLSLTRCYYPDNYYEQTSRSLINTVITDKETINTLEVTKKVPNYKYGTNGAYAGYLIETLLFQKDEPNIEDYPKQYNVNWNPKDTRNYKLIWRLEALKGVTHEDGIYNECTYIFGNIFIDLKEECNKLDRVEIKEDKAYFYFNHARGEQIFDITFVDPIWMPSGRTVKTIGINVTVEDYILINVTRYYNGLCNPENETCQEYVNGTYYKTIEYETKDQVLANITKCKPIGAVEIDGESYYYNEFYCSLFGDDNVPVCNGCNGDGTCETAKLCAEDNSELCFYPVSDELYTGGGFEGTPELKTLPQNLCEVTP